MKTRKTRPSTDTLSKILSERIAVLDGAMGTMIQQRQLSEDDFRGTSFVEHPKPLRGNNDVLSITRPDVIRDIHRAYFQAGADIAETNTFSATTVAQADYGLEEAVWDINVHSARIAREVADEFTADNPDKPRFVAGAMGPTNKTLSLSPDVNDPGYRAITFDALKNAYAEQARALMEGGVDILLIETVFDTLNAKAALFALEEVFDELQVQVPIMVSGTITDASGRTLSGQTTEAFLISLLHAPLLSIGLNCALGAEQLRPYVRILADKSPFAVSAHPNAGLPNAFGEYDQSPEDMVRQIESFFAEGCLNIVGGCCGTTPEHIRALAEAAQKHRPRPRPAPTAHQPHIPAQQNV